MVRATWPVRIVSAIACGTLSDSSKMPYMVPKDLCVKCRPLAISQGHEDDFQLPGEILQWRFTEEKCP